MWVIGDALAAHEAATVLCNQQVILNADTAKVLVGLQQVKVEELLAVSFFLPKVDEVGDEVDTWFISYDEAWFQFASHAQAVGTKLFQVGARLLVETYVYLAQSFHIVYVHTHHMSQSVRQEHGVGTSTYGFFRVTLH